MIVSRNIAHHEVSYSSPSNEEPETPGSQKYLGNFPQPLYLIPLNKSNATTPGLDVVSLLFYKTQSALSPNKVYIAIGRDQHGQQKRAVIKIPDPSIRPGLVTASEVATLDYLRTGLGMPVSKVFQWSTSTTIDNPVCSEYIIMEETSGQARQRLHQIDLGGYGNLYFTKDAVALSLPHFVLGGQLESSDSPLSRFCLSPLATLDSVKSQAGPCNIFVSEEGNISCIIDWQGTAALPFFLHARIPSLLEVSHGVDVLPDNLNSLSKNEQKNLRYYKTLLRNYYLISMKDHSLDWMKILEHGYAVETLKLAATLTSSSSYGGSKDVMLLQELLIALEKHGLSQRILRSHVP
ncbi:hypothetical protein B7463_g11826, partial [Scytalidium lignicola]